MKFFISYSLKPVTGDEAAQGEFRIFDTVTGKIFALDVDKNLEALYAYMVEQGASLETLVDKAKEFDRRLNAKLADSIYNGVVEMEVSN